MNHFRRLNVIAEGQTEERFVNDTLAPYLGDFSISTSVRKVEFGRKKGKIYRGGLLDYDRAKGDILRWMREDRNPEVCFTTMFDLYALPENFPGKSIANQKNDPYQKIDFLESEFGNDISDSRFIPYIQLHEFETLLFVQPERLTEILFENENKLKNLKKIAEKFNGNPELIDEGRQTAPSKRIIELIPVYESQKPTAGATAASRTGIPLLKERCRHFSEWITKLENLSSSTD